MVDADEYLLELAAYIHLNPVRAEMTDSALSYRWSSHRAYLGKETLPWLETGFILSQFSTSEKKARGRFASFVGKRVNEGRRGEFHGEKTKDSRIFGEDRFMEAVLADAESLHQPQHDVHAVLAAVKRLYGLSDERLRSQGRERVACEARSLAAWATLEIRGKEEGSKLHN